VPLGAGHIFADPFIAVFAFCFVFARHMRKVCARFDTYATDLVSLKKTSFHHYVYFYDNAYIFMIKTVCTGWPKKVCHYPIIQTSY